MSGQVVNVIVTGANRGLGLGIVKKLIEEPPITPLHVLACARNPLPDTPLPKNVDVKVQWCRLDIGNQESIRHFASIAKASLLGGVDVLINNAGINLDMTVGRGIEAAKETIKINYDGTVTLTETLMPLMRAIAQAGLDRSSRIVNVSSTGSKLRTSDYSTSRRQEFQRAASMADLNKLRDQYLVSVASGSESEDGWPVGKSYSVSKALMNAWTEILAKQHRNLLINACCPGWCATDMGRLTGPAPKSAADGAKIPLKLAFQAIAETGMYFENPSVFDTADGQPTNWVGKPV